MDDQTTIEVGGESIPLTPENAPRIRQAIGALRTELRDTQAAQARYSLGISQLQALLRYTSNKLKRLGRNPLESSRAT